MDADLIFKDVTVIDGSGAPGFVADVAIAGERIAGMGRLRGLTPARVVEGQGKVLCPGFVDAHGHSDYYLLVLPSADSKVRQGVTTEVAGNCGYSAAPVAGAVAEDRRMSHRELYGLEVDWQNFEQYLSRLAQARPAINVAPLIGFNTVRGSVGLFSSTPASPADLDRMKAMIRESMEAGAFGLSLGLTYAPGCFAGFDEIVACARAAGQVGGVITSHMRSEGDHLIEAVTESVAIARAAEVSFQISHLKTSGPGNWGTREGVLELVAAARDEGVDVTADRYPYLASFTQLSAALPAWMFEAGKEAFFERLRNTEARARARAELAEADPLGDRFERIVISIVASAELKRWEGQNVAAAAARHRPRPRD
jgi:N-acyl-D-amino-acid deacylase